MTDEQAKAVTDRLDRIIELLELQTFVPEDAEAPPCEHPNAKDMSTMGMRPGERMHCPECNATFSRAE